MILAAINWGNALIVTFYGFAVVVVVLMLLELFLLAFGKYMEGQNKTAAPAPAIQQAATVESVQNDGSLTNAESLAIGMALYQYMHCHDDESHILTINNSEPPYHPWSSKIYGTTKSHL